ncbi:hypothetical protein CH063_05697 [Colletotrichum higginsianum]|uniref:Protein kinase domain-containing protein n=1 Tax=Colletotrichum higginsianum (strain IMI 349063) TaxID=759273 RepID=H1UZX8_COLHI|nr:hypothetical protein CH063_05697 [Colletotrichum higginsianum]
MHIASRSKKPKPLEANICPICGEKVASTPSIGIVARENAKGKSVAERGSGVGASFSGEAGSMPDSSQSPVVRLWDHIADHLNQVASWSLRWWDDDSRVSLDAGEGGQSSSMNPCWAISDKASSVEGSGYLDDRIAASVDRSEFPEPNQHFLPVNMLDNLRIIDGMLEKIPDLFESGTDLASYIIQTARKVFLIASCHCYTDAYELKVSMLRFQEHGFDDSHLPIPFPKIGDEATVPAFSPFQSRAETLTFYNSQWYLLAPVFEDGRFKYHFENDHVMPFTLVREVPRQRASGRRVYRVHIHPAHRPSSWITAENSDVSLALEEFHSELLTSGSWEEQSDAALKIRGDNHPHVVQTFACISIGQRKLILREWADGGSLDEYWQRSSPEQSPQFVRKIIEQLHGLVTAMKSLPSEIWQHSRDLNLSPQTILRFEDGSGLGKLKLASFGQLSVGRQDSVTMVQYEMCREPCELLWGDAISSSTWSIMCALEFMVWFLYGWEELRGFRTFLNGDADLKDGYIPAFHHINPFDERPNVEIHSLVTAWMNHMARDSECVGNTALGNLLWFLRDKVNDLSYTITSPNISSLAQGGPSVPQRKTRLGKLLSRAKTVFKRGDGSSKRMSTQSTASHRTPAQTVPPSQSTDPATTQPSAAAAAVATKETPKEPSKNEATQSDYEDSLFALESTLSLQSIQYHLEGILGSGERNSNYYFTEQDRREVLGCRTSLQRNYDRRRPDKQLSGHAQYLAPSWREVDVASVDAFMEIWADLTGPSKDIDDHGTQSTRLLLRMAPAAEFYIAKIMDGETILQEDLWRVAEVIDL